MNYAKEYLKKYDLLTLRTIGRNVGVKNPCLLKKTELIERIIDVKTGKIPPYKTNRGRPVLLTQVLYSEKELELIVQKYLFNERIDKEIAMARAEFLEQANKLKKD